MKDNELDQKLMSIIYDMPENSPDGKNRVRAIKKLLADTVVSELEHVLATSSGGGSWRRIITMRIKKWEKR